MKDKKKNKGLTDFNDLHIAAGIDAVRSQVIDAVERFNKGEQVELPRAPSAEEPPAHFNDIPSPADSPAPSLKGEVQLVTIDDAMRRFALISGGTKVWDEHNHTILKATEFTLEVGEAVSKAWKKAPDKRKVLEQDVRRFIATRLAADKGAGGVGDMLERFIHLEISDTAWDCKQHEIVRINDIRHRFPDVYDSWYKHPNRRNVDKGNLVFDPSGKVDPKTHINMFRGLPLKPVFDENKCRNIRALLWHLTNQDDQVWTWLIKWLAYPLRNLGSKMKTAVLVHSHVHGSGKSLFFDRVMKDIYGENGATLGQHQMESQYTDWQSKLMWGVFEEIFSRDTKYSNMGNIKQLVTGETTRIEKKFVSSWEEASFVNSAFLSNEIQPFPVEPSDRRFLVFWPNGKLPAEIQQGVAHELANDGPAAFYGWLLKSKDICLDGFSTETQPPMTKAKERLISFSLASWEVFLREWEAGETDAPYFSCLTDDLWVVYQRWCKRGGYHQMQKHKFAECMGTKISKRPQLEYDSPGGWGKPSKKSVHGTFYLLHDKPSGKTQKEWLSDCVLVFRNEIGAGEETAA